MLEKSLTLACIRFASATNGCMTFLAIEIGGTKLQIYAGSGSGEIFERHRFSVVPAAGGEGIRAQILEVLPTLFEKWKPAAIGVGYGGPVDWKTGRVQCSHHIAGWDDFPLADWLHEHSRVPVFVENDANAAALAEALHGAGRGYSTVFYVQIGTGVGGGLVVDGRLYHSAAPGEMEIGHVRLDRESTTVEDMCSGRMIDRHIREMVDYHPETVLARLARETADGGDARLLVPALAEGCWLAEEMLTTTMEYLAFALGHVVQLLHPEIIVFGGGLALIGEPLRERLARALPQWVMTAFQPGPRVALSELKEDAVPVGALALAHTRMSH